MVPYVCSGPLYNSANGYDDDVTRNDEYTSDPDKFVATIATCCGGYANVVLSTSVTRLEHGK